MPAYEIPPLYCSTLVHNGTLLSSICTIFILSCYFFFSILPWSLRDNLFLLSSIYLGCRCHLIWMFWVGINLFMCLRLLCLSFVCVLCSLFHSTDEFDLIHNLIPFFFRFLNMLTLFLLIKYKKKILNRKNMTFKTSIFFNAFYDLLLKTGELTCCSFFYAFWFDIKMLWDILCLILWRSKLFLELSPFDCYNQIMV